MLWSSILLLAISNSPQTGSSRSLTDFRFKESITLEEGLLQASTLHDWDEVPTPFDLPAGVIATAFDLDKVIEGDWLLILGCSPSPPKSSLNGVALDLPYRETVIDALSLNCWSIRDTQLKSGTNVLIWESQGIKAGPCLLTPPPISRQFFDTLSKPSLDSSIMNLAIESGVESDGRPLGRLFSRDADSSLGRQLEALLSLSFRVRGKELSLSEFETVDVGGGFPQKRIQLKDPRLGDIDITASFVACIDPDDAEFSSLPVIRATFNIRTQSKVPLPIDVCWRAIPIRPGEFSHEKKGDFTIVHNGSLGLGIVGRNVSVEKGPVLALRAYDQAALVEKTLSQVSMDLFVGINSNGDSRNDIVKALDNARQNIPRSRQGLRRLRDQVPYSRNATIDTELSHAIHQGLKAIVNSPEGIRADPSLSEEEFFWATSVGLIQFPKFERDMLTRSIESQLPLSLAGGLRALRYLWWTRDPEALASWESVLTTWLDRIAIADSKPDEIPWTISSWLTGSELFTHRNQPWKDSLERVHSAPSALSPWAAGFLMSSDTAIRDALRTWNWLLENRSSPLKEGTASDIAQALANEDVRISSIGFGTLVFGVYGAFRESVDRLHLRPWILSDRLIGNLPMPGGAVQLSIQSTPKDSKLFQVRISGDRSSPLTILIEASGFSSSESHQLQLQSGRSHAQVELRVGAGGR